MMQGILAQCGRTCTIDIEDLLDGARLIITAKGQEHLSLIDPDVIVALKDFGWRECN